MRFNLPILAAAILSLVSLAPPSNTVFADLPRIVVSDDGSHFQTEDGLPFVVWGVNYDHDSVGDGRLLTEY